jgi:O-succinylhomoserine sulfhydrylase
MQACPRILSTNWPSVSNPSLAVLCTFELKGGRDAAWRFIDGTRLMSITANLGDAKSTITHPATTTHGRLSAEAKADAGITEGLIRIGRRTGRHVGDLQKDCERGLAAIA